MITYEQALEAVIKNTHRLGPEKILLEKSIGRILNENVYSEIAMPPFDKSAMDGYAVKAADVKSALVKLKCIGVVQAGQVFKKKLKRGECVKIMTGAPVPAGADSVVMIEDTRECAGFVEVFKAAVKKENICFKGEDLKAGQRVLKKGEEISSSAVAILATVGRRLVEVIQKPKVSLISTGGEIIPPGLKLPKNKIYNSNGPLLCAFLQSDGISPQFLGIVKDKASDLRERIKKGLNADMLLISGGVSMGDYDLIPPVLRGLGVREIFHKVNIKPGKPFFLGIKNKTVIFGIPGNPVSNFLSYLIFVRPAIHKMMGCKNYGPVFKEGIVGREFHARPGRRHFVLAKITKKARRYQLLPVSGHGSADTLSLSKADGFMMIDENASFVKINSRIKFITWKPI